MVKGASKNTISLFPLPGIVLFPGTNLPLHILEEKYKKMISRCLESDKRFGIVLAKGKQFAEVGTTALIIGVEKLASALAGGVLPVVVIDAHADFRSNAGLCPRA